MRFPLVRCLSILAGFGTVAAIAHAEPAREVVKLSAIAVERAGITIERAQAPGQDKSRGNGDTMRLNGRVTLPNRSVEILTAKLTGRVQAVLVNVGEEVRPGTALARIESSEYVALQREYLHALAAAETTSQKLARDGDLFDAGIIPRGRLEETRSTHAHAAATLAEARQMLRLAGMPTARVTKLTNADAIESTWTVIAQRKGLVLQQQSVPGARVEAGDVLFKLGDIATLWLELQADRGQLPRLHIGDEASLVGCELQGRVLAINQELSASNQTALVRVEFERADRCLRPNQFAEVDVTTTTTVADAVTIPASAVVQIAGRDYVYVQVADGFEQRPAAVHSRQGNTVWVNSLAEGTPVVTRGLATLRGAALGLGNQ